MARPLPLNPTFLPPTYGVLKSLLENPLKLPLHHEDGEKRSLVQVVVSVVVSGAPLILDTLLYPLARPIGVSWAVSFLKSLHKLGELESRCVVVAVCKLSLLGGMCRCASKQ